MAAPLKDSGLFNGGINEPISLGATTLEIPAKYKDLAPGNELIVGLRMYEFQLGGKKDIIINYEIRNEEGSIVLKQHDTVAVETQASLLKTFNLPQNLSPGRYVVSYNIQTLEGKPLTTATASFEVSKPIQGYPNSRVPPSYSKSIFIAIGSFLIFIILSFFIFYKKRGFEFENKPSINKQADYKDLIERIIKRNIFFGDEKSAKLANRIKGLKVSPQGNVLQLKENGPETMINLIDLYRISMGQSSLNIARMAIRDILKQNPNLKVPKELLTA